MYEGAWSLICWRRGRTGSRCSVGGSSAPASCSEEVLAGCGPRCSGSAFQHRHLVK